MTDAELQRVIDERRRILGRRRRWLKLTVVAAVVLLVAAGGVFAWFSATGSNSADASIGLLNPPTSVTASTTASSGTVSVSWTASSTAGPAIAPQGYYVKRIKNSDSSVVFACGSSPTSLITGTSCTNTAVTDGTYHYMVVAVFSSWTAGSVASNDVTVVNDATPPTTSITFPTGGFHNATDYNASCSPTGVCGTASDTSGVAVVRVSVQRDSDGFYWNGTSFASSGSELFKDATLTSSGGTSTDWNLALPLPADDGYTVHVQAKDTVGNDSAPSYTSTRAFSIDTTAPSTSLTTTPASPDGSNGWFQRSSVSFTLSASDGGSGVANTYYTIDGGSQQTYSSSVSINTQGDHTVTYWSVDNVGNTETTHTTHIKLDNVAPSTGITITPASPDGSSGWRVSATSFTLSSSDATSGVATTKYQIDGGTVTTYPGSAVTIPEGTHTVSYWSVDSAGNIESTHTTAAIKVDTIKPATTITVSPSSPNGSNSWYKTTQPTFTLSGSDATSGVATTKYQIDGGTVTTYPGSAVTIPEGTHTISYWSVDNAGNTETTNTTATIKVDTVKPTDTVSLGASPSHAFLNTGTSTLYFKGNAVGSFSLVDTVSDTTSGPASATFPTFNTFGWTGAGGGVSTPAGGPYSSSYSWTATQTLNPTSGTVSSTDTAGNASIGKTLTLANDTTAPTVSITSPSAGNVSGTVSLAASASDAGSGMASVAYYRCNTTCTGTPLTAPGNWTQIASSSSGPSWTGSWDSTAVANGPFTLEAVATDNVGNQSASAGVAVTTTNYSFTVSDPSSPSNTVTAATADPNSITIQLQLNGIPTGTMAGSAYTGSHSISLSGSAMTAAPDGTLATPSSVALSFNSSGQATVAASTITFARSASAAVLSATDTTNSIAGSSTSFAIGAGAVAKLAWTGVTATGGTVLSPCLFTCSWTGANSKSLSGNISATDAHGNVVSGIGSGHGASLALSGSNPPNGSVSPTSVTFPTTGAASVAWTYTAPNGNWGPVTMTAATTAGTSFSSATLSISK